MSVEGVSIAFIILEVDSNIQPVAGVEDLDVELELCVVVEVLLEAGSHLERL